MIIDIWLLLLAETLGIRELTTSFKFQHTSILESKTAKNQLGTFFSIKSALNVQIYDNP